jgi:hypothetical protein
VRTDLIDCVIKLREPATFLTLKAGGILIADSCALRGINEGLDLLFEDWSFVDLILKSEVSRSTKTRSRVLTGHEPKARFLAVSGPLDCVPHGRSFLVWMGVAYSTDGHRDHKLKVHDHPVSR